MNALEKIYVAGHRGLVGSALMRNLRDKGHTHFVTRTHAELDLTEQAAVDAFFAVEKPNYAFLAATYVGMRSQRVTTRLIQDSCARLPDQPAAQVERIHEFE